jgi:hypothetical protein
MLMEKIESRKVELYMDCAYKKEITLEKTTFSKKKIFIHAAKIPVHWN